MVDPSEVRLLSNHKRPLFREWKQILTYFTVAGCIRTTDRWLLLGFLLAAVGSRHSNSPISQLPQTYLLIVPMLAGSALLDTARSGKLDLLFASGVSRRRAWTASACRVLVLHTSMVVVIASISRGARGDATLAALVILALGNAALGHAGGLFRPAITFGMTWLALRIAFVLIPAGASLREHVELVESGRTSPVAWKLLLSTLFAPESVLTRHNMPPYVLVAYVAAAAVALLLSYQLFAVSNFTGRRRE